MSEHAIAYTGKNEPPPLPGERPARGGGHGLLSSIRIDPDTPEQKLDDRSRVNFAKVYTIEHYSKVQSLGKVNRASMPVLLQQFQMVWSKAGRNFATPYSERIAAYHTLCAGGWSAERASKVMFTDAGFAVPFADLGAGGIVSDDKPSSQGQGELPSGDLPVDNAAVLKHD